MSQGAENPTEAQLAASQAAARAVREAIAQARPQCDELLVLAAHDIRNAIGIVDSALTMIEDAPDLGPSMHAMMRRATHRLGILTRAMVDVDLLQRDAMPLAPAVSRWSAIAGPAVDATLAVAATKQITIVQQGAADAALTCDRTLVERTLVALLDHMVALAPEGGAVDLEGRRAGEARFLVRLAHAGRPVAGDVLQKYFTTLPLKYARLAAVRHGGTLRAVSPLEGGAGLAFELELGA